MSDAPLVWSDGALVSEREAAAPVLSHALHYGTGVFEGVRVYDTERGPAAFRLGDHLARLLDSARAYGIDIPYTREELHGAVAEVVRAAGFASCYVRPIAFCGAGTMAVLPRGAATEVRIAAWEWGAYLGDAAANEGVRAIVSSWRRMGSDSLIPSAKATGQYLNSVLARREADRAGCDEAIMLDRRGMVSEGTGENLFVVRDGAVATPGLTSSILPGITRASVIELARDLGRAVVERDVERGELYVADEVFMTGTAVELVPVREIDGIAVGDGSPGPITRALQAALADALRGRDERHRAWSEPLLALPARA